MEIKGRRGWSRGKCGGFHRGGGERTIKKVVERRAAAFTVSLPELKSCQSTVALATSCSAHLCFWLVGAATVGGGKPSISIWKYLHTAKSDADTLLRF